MPELRKFIRRYTSIDRVTDMLKSGRLSIPNPEKWKDQNDKHFMRLYKDAIGVRSVYALCATRYSETYHHWGVFSDGDTGACVELKLPPLERALSRRAEIKARPVHYLTLGQVEALTPADVAQLPFVKRIGYSDEREYRIVVTSTSSQKAASFIDLEIDWINTIYLSPHLSDVLAIERAHQLRSLPGCDKLRIRKSRLIESDRWKAAGERVCGL